MNPQILLDKLWTRHVVREEPNGPSLLYINRHLVNEVTSPQAFEGLRIQQRTLWRAQSIMATADHNVPTTRRADGIADPAWSRRRRKPKDWMTSPWFCATKQQFATTRHRELRSNRDNFRSDFFSHQREINR